VDLKSEGEHDEHVYKDWPSLKRFRKRLTSWVDKNCFAGVDCAIKFTESFMEDGYVSIAEAYYPLDGPEYLDVEKR